MGFLSYRLKSDDQKRLNIEAERTPASGCMAWLRHFGPEFS
jgi:hypothetical protein